MKTMTCKQLGGACDLEFRAESFEEIAVLSKNHGMEMFQKGDQEHLEAMGAMTLDAFATCLGATLTPVRAAVESTAPAASFERSISAAAGARRHCPARRGRSR